MQIENQFYTITNDAEPAVLTCRFPSFPHFENSTVDFYVHRHESTYKFWDISAKRWIIAGNAFFYNKGRGKRVMYSDFLIIYVKTIL